MATVDTTHPLPPLPDPLHRTDWPYPRWIAHRGAGLEAPENTLAAFQRGARHGYRMIECDVRLSADGVSFLLHDDTLERTTSGSGQVGGKSWAELSVLDAGTWHSTPFKGEPIPTLAAAAAWCQAHGVCLNIEIKPSPGTASETGQAVAQASRQLWADHPLQPLLSSFSTVALAAARTAAPELPRALLLENRPPGWVEQALALGCVAVIGHWPVWDASAVGQARKAGLRTLAYTVNSAVEADFLLGLGLDGLITDRVDLFTPGEAVG
jgi:glycerophosphoryl diester phosphodiesterase